MPTTAAGAVGRNRRAAGNCRSTSVCVGAPVSARLWNCTTPGGARTSASMPAQPRHEPSGIGSPRAGGRGVAQSDEPDTRSPAVPRRRSPRAPACRPRGTSSLGRPSPASESARAEAGERGRPRSRCPGAPGPLGGGNRSASTSANTARVAGDGNAGVADTSGSATGAIRHYRRAARQRLQRGQPECLDRARRQDHVGGREQAATAVRSARSR